MTADSSNVKALEGQIDRTVSKIGALAERVKKMRAPTLETEPERFQIVRWFDQVCESRAHLEAAVAYFKTALEDARPHMTAVGPLETMLAETPGLVHFYSGILIDAQQIRRWLEAVRETTFARRYKHYMFDQEIRRKYGELKTTEITKMVQAEDTIGEMDLQIRLIANVENHLLNVNETFTTRNINLSRIVEVRKANLQDVWIDPTKGTENV